LTIEPTAGLAWRLPQPTRAGVNFLSGNLSGPGSVRRLPSEAALRGPSREEIMTVLKNTIHIEVSSNRVCFAGLKEYVESGRGVPG
jgi:hypothetical protein